MPPAATQSPTPPHETEDTPPSHTSSAVPHVLLFSDTTNALPPDQPPAAQLPGLGHETEPTTELPPPPPRAAKPGTSIALSHTPPFSETRNACGLEWLSV